MSLIHLLYKLVPRTSDPILFIPLILPGNPVSDTAGIIRHQRTFGLNHYHLPNRLKPRSKNRGFICESRQSRDEQTPQISSDIFLIPTSVFHGIGSCDAPFKVPFSWQKFCASYYIGATVSNRGMAYSRSETFNNTCRSMDVLL